MPKLSTYTALALVLAVVAALAYLFLPNGAVKPSGTANLSANAVQPGTFPLFNCPMHAYQANSEIVNVRGMAVYNVSGASDYVIGQGSTGTITYRVTVGASMVQGQNGTLNESNWVQIYHASGGNETQETEEIAAAADPTEISTRYNSSYTVNATITAGREAAEGTYWMILSPGPCFGGPSGLLTVGNAPYSGEITGYAVQH